MTELEITKTELEKEFDGVVAKINILRGNIDTIENNQIENRVTTGVAFSLLPWIAMTLSTSHILNAIEIPDAAIQPLYCGIPILAGIAGEALIAKLRNYKTKLRSFTTATSQRELLEQKTRCKMNQKKCSSVAAMLKETYTQVESRETLLETLPEEYTQAENTNLKDIPSLERNIANLESLLKSKIAEIDIYSSQETLCEVFKENRERLNFIDWPVKASLGAVGSTAIFGLPSIYMNTHGGNLTETRGIQILCATAIGGAISFWYLIKKNLDYNYVFKRINAELKENSIPAKRSDTDEAYSTRLERAIHEAAAIKYQLESEKRQLESLMPDTPKVLQKAMTE